MPRATPAASGRVAANQYEKIMAFQPVASATPVDCGKDLG
jgi:hypothetical protein